MACYLGIDTSNYRTSAAVYDSEAQTGVIFGKLLEVPSGSRGLRQSDAVFAHVRQLPEVVEKCLARCQQLDFSAVGASVAPRSLPDSYMPCFLVGKTCAQTTAHAMHVPFYGFSHQQGHIAAAAWSAQALELLNAPFLAWHLSGGTTELLLVEPDPELLIRERCIGGTTDISAGQLVDRAGVAMGAKFPAGPELEAMAEGFGHDRFYRVGCRDLQFSLSGMENRVQTMLQKDTPHGEIAAFVIDTVLYAITTATRQALQRYPGLPVLCSGGVMSNRWLQQQMHAAFGAHFARPELSGDNALGIAILTAAKAQQVKTWNKTGFIR